MVLIALSNNENSLGCSPDAQRAATATADVFPRYARCGDDRLQAALASFHGISRDGVFCGPGSWSLLQLIAQAVLTLGQTALMSEFSFRGFSLVTEQAHGVVRRAREASDGPDVAEMIAAVGGARLIFLANPDNPSGKLLRRRDVLRLVEAADPGALVIVDEAYIEYAGRGASESVLQDVTRYQNLVVLRSFSKVYGLAGVRLGWGLASPSVATHLSAAQTPHHLSAQAVEAGLAAIADQEFVALCVERNRAERDRLREGLLASGFPTYQSASNFLMVDVRSCPDVASRLLQANIEVRDLNLYGRAGWIRVTVGLPNENAAFLAALRELAV